VQPVLYIRVPSALNNNRAIVDQPITTSGLSVQASRTYASFDLITTSGLPAQSRTSSDFGWITTSGLSAQSRRGYSVSGVRHEFSPSCPTVFKTRSGQRIAITLYSFRGSHVTAAKPEVHRPESEKTDTAVAVASCDVGPVIVIEVIKFAYY